MPLTLIFYCLGIYEKVFYHETAPIVFRGCDGKEEENDVMFTCNLFMDLQLLFLMHDVFLCPLLKAANPSVCSSSTHGG